MTTPPEPQNAAARVADTSAASPSRTTPITSSHSTASPSASPAASSSPPASASATVAAAVAASPESPLPPTRADRSSFMCICGQPPGHTFLLECHYCAHWFHGDCVRVSEAEAMRIIRFACPLCAKQGHPTLTYSGGPHTTASSESLPYAPLPMQRRFAPYPSSSISTNASISTATSASSSATSSSSAASASSGVAPTDGYRKNSELFRRTLRTAVFARSGVRAIASQHLVPSYFTSHDLNDPLLVVDANWSASGLTRALPVVSLQDISTLLVNNTCAVRAVDIGSQDAFTLSTTGWTARLAHPSAESPVNAHFRVQETAFRQEVSPPLAVAAADWHHVMPSANGASVRTPNPDMYGSLCGAQTFLDFTIAPDARAYWLSVASGTLSVFLIAPTAANVRAFADWKATPTDVAANVFLADRVETCIKCEVPAEASLVVPAGWIVALFTENGASFFSGLFSNTLNLATQLRVWCTLEEDPRVAPQWHTTSFMRSWSAVPLAPSVSPAPPFNAQVWSLVCHYINELAHVEGVQRRVSVLEHDALQRALPMLRRWGVSGHALQRQDSVSWLPTSARDAESLMEQLEQGVRAVATVYQQVPVNPRAASIDSLHADGRVRQVMESVSASEISPMDTGDISNRFMYGTAAAATTSNNNSNNNDMWGTGGLTSGFAGAAASFPAAGVESEPSAATSGWGDYSGYHAMHGGSGGHDQMPRHCLDPAPITSGSHGGSPYYHSGMDGSSFQSSLQQQQQQQQQQQFAPTGGMSSSPQMFGSFVGNASGVAPSAMGMPSLGHPSMLDNNGGTATGNAGGGANAMGLGPGYGDMLVRHRASCHRCGNLRKKNVRCSQCPHIFCQKCAEKMLEEHGESIFVEGCPVCKELCCCGKNRTMMCPRKFHCYKKCPATKRPAA